MNNGANDDLLNWINYRVLPTAAETDRMLKIIQNDKKVKELLDFGFRPLSRLDEYPWANSHDLMKPYEVIEEDLFEKDMLVDINTGFRFWYSNFSERPVLDSYASGYYSKWFEILKLASDKTKKFKFEVFFDRRYHQDGHVEANEETILPLVLHVKSKSELKETIDDLKELFCIQSNCAKLWFRGQNREYFLNRSSILSEKIYGKKYEPSLLPSAGRYAMAHPDEMNLSLATSGPNHYWKKPFLIWIMRQNYSWFSRDKRALDLLSQVLVDDDDKSFAQILIAMKFGSEIAQLEENISWPIESDDLCQWFFAHMKSDAFSITLQQYGYITTLLDITEDLDVALYFTHAKVINNKMTKQIDDNSSRVIYIFAQPKSLLNFYHGKELFWGDVDWIQKIPPRLDYQKAGFIRGSTCRSQNLYSNMVVAKIFLENNSIQSSIEDNDLFPDSNNDLLFKTLLESKPKLIGLY